jgi:hypothetical protein
LRKHIFVRPATEADALVFLDWAITNKDKNDFDPAAPLYPGSFTFCAYDEDGPLAFMPFQQPLAIDGVTEKRPVRENPIYLEGLATRPGISRQDMARALKELLQMAVTMCHIQGRGEIYFLGTDEETDALAANHLFEKLPYPVYRLRMSDLEKKKCG